MSLIGRQYEVTDFNLVHSLLAIRGRQPSVRWEAHSRCQISTSTFSSGSGSDWNMILNLGINASSNFKD